MRLLTTFLCSATVLAATEAPYLLQQPAMNQSQIVFVYAGDLWSVARSGGAAIRLTTGRGVESDPRFSPDGKTIAFTADYDGNVDVFTIPATGGMPVRITAHPGTDRVAGWTPDGKKILFISGRDLAGRALRLFAVSREGGFPEPLPFPSVAGASLSPDGSQMAYMPTMRADEIWKRYRGGRTTPIWIGNLADSSVKPLPRKDSNDHSPMWIGKDIYFLSDRDGGYTLYRYDTRSAEVTQVIRHQGLDIKSATAGPDGIVYEQFGEIKIFDLKTSKCRTVPITLSGDLPELRTRIEKVQKYVTNARLSPSGARVVLEARGDIFTVPAEKGNSRNITHSPGAADRDPAWSPDGKWIAYFSDESGEYALHLSPQNGQGEVTRIPLDTAPSFFYRPVWSPDSKKIAYSDKLLNLWYIDLDRKTPTQVAHSTYEGWDTDWNARWSPDSKWLAYSRQLRNHLAAISIFSIESGQAKQITDGMSDAQFPVWDRGGKYLYLSASTDSGPSLGGIDMSTFNRPVTRSVYVVVLRKEDVSPLAPESDEEKAIAAAGEDVKLDARKVEAAKTPALDVTIDFDGIEQRTVPLPLPAANYQGLYAGKGGILFLLEAPALPNLAAARPGRPSAPATVLHRFDLAKRKAERFVDGISRVDVSDNGEKLLYRLADGWFLAGTMTPPKPGEGRLRLDDLEMRIEPAAEWKQMYKEVLRLERDFFYDPNHHGLDLQALGERYEKYLSHLGSREDLNYLWKEMLGQLTVGHLYINGGDSPERPLVVGGLLGADYTIENGRYRFAKIFIGENWNPLTRAPLTQPGINVKEGEYLLAVNGRELRGTDEIYALFEGSGGKNTSIKVGPDPAGANAREVLVVPTESETALRRLDWMERNRRKVDQATKGQVGYIYLPDTSVAGYTYFNRYYFAQADRRGLIVDERFNAGGKAADYMIDYLRRPIWNYWSSRDGEVATSPANNIVGPKVMIINEYAGSGGDALPWYFKRAKIGPLVGKRTWGGLVGIGGYPPLIDGGTVTAPHFAFWSPDGNWDVENHGIDPDIEVELDPTAWREGRDTQLEKAIEVVVEQLRNHPPISPERPPYPNYNPGKPNNQTSQTGGE